MTDYRRELGIGDETRGDVRRQRRFLAVVGAGGRRLRAAMPEVTFVINGDGSARHDLERSRRIGAERALRRLPAHASGCPRCSPSADVHVVPLRAGLGSVSVPSKTYSILAAGRPVLAAIDPDTEVPRILVASGGGVAVAPDDTEAFIAASAAA